MSTTPLFLDCWKQGQTGTTEQTGLEHLEKQTVYALVDEVYQGPFTVAGGAITLDSAGTSSVYIGLSYDSSLKTLPVDFGQLVDVIQGRVQRLLRTQVAVEDTQKFRIRLNGGSWYSVDLGSITDTLKEIKVLDPYAEKVELEIEAVDNGPLTVLAVLTDLEIAEY